MSLRHLVTLSLVCSATLVTAAMRGGCAPDPCPNLYIACPDLECPEGFKVDKNGCATCACVGELPEGCLSDADCPAGLVCSLPTPVPMTDDVRCLDGAEGERCGAPLAGECVEPHRDFCEELSEWACIEHPDCEPVYADTFCDCLDCFCAEEQSFVGCVARQVHDECRSDADCPNGYCEFVAGCSLTDCGGGAVCVYPSCDDGSEPLCDMIPPSCGPGEVLAVRDHCFSCVDARSCQTPEPGCFDDSDCAEGEFCAMTDWDCAEGELDCGMVPGVCLPRPDGCAGLDENSCLSTAGCLPVYEALPCAVCECPEGADCLCGDDTSRCDEPVFAGCVEEIVGCFGAWLDQNGTCRAPNDGVYPAECCGVPACRSDADCGEGGSCFDGLCVGAPTCPDREDPAVHYLNEPEHPELCQQIDFLCAEDQLAFSDSCGCGCIDLQARPVD